LSIDDSLDLFAEHAIGGTIGLLANACFADPKIVALDGLSQIQGGWVVQNWYATDSGRFVSMFKLFAKETNLQAIRLHRRLLCLQ
jgi:ammonia channel protein AmtB